MRLLCLPWKPSEEHYTEKPSRDSVLFYKSQPRVIKSDHKTSILKFFRFFFLSVRFILGWSVQSYVCTLGMHTTCRLKGTSLFAATVDVSHTLLNGFFSPGSQSQHLFKLGHVSFTVDGYEVKLGCVLCILHVNEGFVVFKSQLCSDNYLYWCHTFDTDSFVHSNLCSFLCKFNEWFDDNFLIVVLPPLHSC